jgi:hypothetical protein
VTRHNEPIENVRVKHSVDPDIDFSIEFLGWQAAVKAGANLDQLLKWDNGEYPRVFMARVIAWYELSGLVEAHQEDASMSKDTNG